VLLLFMPVLTLLFFVVILVISLSVSYVDARLLLLIKSLLTYLLHEMMHLYFCLMNQDGVCSASKLFCLL